MSIATFDIGSIRGDIVNRNINILEKDKSLEIKKLIDEVGDYLLKDMFLNNEIICVITNNKEVTFLQKYPVHKCNLCKSDSRYMIYLDKREMSDGQELMYTMGLSERTFFCTSCYNLDEEEVQAEFDINEDDIWINDKKEKKYTMRSIEKKRNREYKEARLKGRIIEEEVSQEYRENGYFVNKLSIGYKYIIEKWIKDKKINDEEKLKSFLFDNNWGKGMFDLIAIKEGEVCFIECKSEKSRVNENQISWKERAEKEGYKCIIEKRIARWEVSKENDSNI